MKSVLVLLAILLFAVSSLSLANPGKGKSGKPDQQKHERKEHREDLRDIEDGVELVASLITVGEARRIAESIGATGYKPLPPGIRKNLARGKPMPPGIQKSRMPGNMLNRLPGHDGYEWRSAGTDLLLVQAGTHIVADVLTDVFK